MTAALAVRVHDAIRPAEEVSGSKVDQPAWGAQIGNVATADEVEVARWLVARPGSLLAHTLDYGVTRLPGIDMTAGAWQVRVAVWNRVVADELDDRLADEDHASFNGAAASDLDSEDALTGPQQGPEI